MLVALCLAVVTQQAFYGPTLPAGSSPDIGQAFAAIEEPMSKGDFAEATNRLKLLPTLTVGYSWDDSKIPANQRPDFADARDDALRQWSQKVPGLTFKASEKPQIKFSFEPTLATVPDTGMPRGIALFFSDDLTKPRMEAVIGLKRGNPLEPTSDISVHNEVLFAIGSYLGMSPHPFPTAAMGRQDYQMQARNMVDLRELGMVGNIQIAIGQLKDGIKKGRKFVPTRPKLDCNPDQIDHEPVLQGTPVDLSLQVNNTGEGAISYIVIPDCGCISATPGGLVDSGGSSIVRVRINTSEIAGSFSKHLIVLSNDVENPVRMIPIKVQTMARYRFLSDTGPVAIVGDSGLDANVYFVTPSGNPMEITGIQTAGNPATVSYEPWKGDLADPDMQEGSKPREGYRIKLHLAQPEVSGRSALGLLVKTTDPQYPELRFTLFVQKGIAVMPSQMYFGEIGHVQRTGSIVLSRPGKPFKITKIDSDSAFVKATAKMVKGDSEYRLDVVYDGKALEGDLRATITVLTDDPKQPKILIPVLATIR